MGLIYGYSSIYPKTTLAGYNALGVAGVLPVALLANQAVKTPGRQQAATRAYEDDTVFWRALIICMGIVDGTCTSD